MSYSLSDLTRILINAARNAGTVDNAGDVYSSAEKTDAIVGILNDFARRTWCLRHSFTVDLTQDSDAVSFSATGFDPRRIVSMTVDSAAWATAHLIAGVVTSISVNESLTYTVAPTVTFSGGGDGSGAAATANLTLGKVTSFTITNGGSGYTSVPDVLLGGSRVNYDPQSARNNLAVRRCDIEQINSEIARCGTASGDPRLIAFADPALTATIYPKPKADGTLTVTWSPAAALTENGTISYAIPDDMAATAVRSGGVSFLQHGIEENIPITDRAWQKYLAHVSACSGVGGSASSFRRNTERRADW